MHVCYHLLIPNPYCDRRYENDVVEEDVYIRFKDDTELDKTMPKKTIAVQQAKSFYERLAQPEE